MQQIHYSYDLHFNVLKDRYASELKWLIIIPREKAFFHAKLQVPLLLWFLSVASLTSPSIVMYVGMARIIIY